MSTPRPTPPTFSTVGAQGRVIIPAEVRRVLGINGGERVEFVVGDGEVRLVTPRMRVEGLWAKNTAQGVGDSTRAVREDRAADQRADVAAEQRIADRLDAETRGGA